MPSARLRARSSISANRVMVAAPRAEGRVRLCRAAAAASWAAVGASWEGEPGGRVALGADAQA